MNSPVEIKLCYMLVFTWNLCIPLDEWKSMRKFDKELANNLPAEFQRGAIAEGSYEVKILECRKIEEYGYWVSCAKSAGNRGLCL